MKTFFGGRIKKSLHDLCGRKFVGKSHTKTFRASLGKFRQKPFATPKICLLVHLWFDGMLSPSFVKGDAAEPINKIFQQEILFTQLHVSSV